jgi:ABC-type Fe3+-hydroxamate transport system substrate-binding protein
VTLTDDEGTSVTIPAEPEQIATLTNAATETMFALGLGDR